MRFDAVLENRKSYGAVWCGFKTSEKVMVRFGFVIYISHGAVRIGSPLNRFFDGAVPMTVGKTVHHTFIFYGAALM